MRSSALLGTVLLLSVGAFLAPADLEGQLPDGLQNQSWLSVGYVVNAPNIFTGASIMYIHRSGLGVFVDGKMEFDDPTGEEGFIPGMTAAEARDLGDALFREQDVWSVFNAGLVYVITREFALYGGAGLSRFDRYGEYFDEEGERGTFGYYWVEDAAAHDRRVNLTGGALLRGGERLRFQFGVETAPGGVVVGVHYAFPL